MRIKDRIDSNSVSKLRVGIGNKVHWIDRMNQLMGELEFVD